MKPSFSSAALAASTCGTKWATWSSTSSPGCGTCATSVATAGIDAVLEGLPFQKPLEIRKPGIEELVNVAGVVAAHMRKRDQVGSVPERRIGRQRLRLEHVQHGAGERALCELLPQRI